jgi:flavorubredoxin
MVVKLKDGIFWVGAVDWNIRDFHGYITNYGTTYNAYLIKSQKNVLVDTVKAGFEDQLFYRLSQNGVTKLDYIVVNHLEMDHTSALKKVIEKFPDAVIVTSKKGDEGIRNIYGIEHETQVIKTGSQLEIGDKTLTFIETPMVHWPDSMATYIVEDKVLLPNDAFGLHYASNRRFDYEFSEQEIGRLYYEAAKYYANIVLPYSKQVQNVLKKIENLSIEVIGPSHGIIWSEKIPEVIENYKKWSSGLSDEKIIVLYDTMWKHTEKAAFEIIKGIEDEGVDYRFYRIGKSDFSEMITEVMLAKGIIIGSPTLNRELFPTVAAFLTYMKGLKPFGKVGATFGSYGWSGEAVGKIVEVFKELKFEVVGSARFKFVSDEEELRELGREVARRVKS